MTDKIVDILIEHFEYITCAECRYFNYVFDDGSRMCDNCDHKHSQWKLGIEKAEEVAKTIRKTMEE